MEALKKFKLFLLLVVFCLLNLAVYKYFSGSLTLNLYRSPTDKSSEMALSGGEPASSQTNGVASVGRESSPESGVSSSAAVNMTNKPSSGQGLPVCPLVPPRLNGLLATYRDGPDFTAIAKENPGLRPGGLYAPPDCTARHRVAIVIPYRNRDEHLRVFLHNIHPFLARQQLDYGIYVIDQALPGKFNRAMLMNIGYVEAMKRHDYQCAIFHDVDLIPENDRNLYSCPEQPRHMSAAIDKFKYKLPYPGIFGGVSAISKDHMVLINGYSNIFFGWGGEDDDMATRIGAKGLKITRYPMEIARYRMIKHTGEKHNEANPKRFSLLRNTKQRMPYDGINHLFYKVTQVEELPSHTRIEVLIDEKEVLEKTKPS